MLSFPIGVGIVVVAPTFVRAFLGSDWLPVVETMQLIAVYGLLVSMAATFGPVWKAVGRPDYITKLSAARLVIMAALAVPAINRFGITGMAAVVVGVYLFIIMPLDVYLAAKTVETSSLRVLRLAFYPTVASGVMGAVVYLVQQRVAFTPVVEFVLLVATGATVYLLLVLLLATQFRWEVTGDLRRIVEAVRG